MAKKEEIKKEERTDKPLDKEDVLDKEIKPMIDKIYKVCTEHGMPFFFDVLFFNDTNKTKSCTSQFCPDDTIPPRDHMVMHLLKRDRERDAVLLLLSGAVNRAVSHE